MTSPSSAHDQRHVDVVCLYALQALPASEVAAVEAQIAGCPECRKEIDALRPIVGAFGSWPADVLRPSGSLWDRLARRIAGESSGAPRASARQSLPARPHAEPRQWDEPAPGISVQLLATDTERKRVSMLVRLAPNTEYPPHRHAGVEELYLLDGELVVDDRTLYPGDYIRAVAGSVDRRVWSETGCTCVLLTSTEDELF